tara:strand:+ start:1410 stop:1955 length:546 start_codon:yes stop_codon:yes gene_type:complete
MMIWAREFLADMLPELKPICENFTKNNPPEAKGTYKAVGDSDCWCIPPLGPNRERLYAPEVEQLSAVRALVAKTTGLNVDYDMPFISVWRFGDYFPRCPVHVDPGKEHTGSVVTCISGELQLHLHEENLPDSPIINTINVKPSRLIALNNTHFPHSVSGWGDLVVFGTDKATNAEEYFKDA